ncbi:MAG: hypothetical protein HY576_08285, partial [candidate division NC10 bacterium]|nr:hypothetical protein [candidate division NC10 bacterium]
EQNLSLNSSKISGACGRLKCCLSYEYTMYQDLRRGLPRIGGHVMTHQGPGLVKQHHVLEEGLMVQLEDGRFVRYLANEVAVRKADYPDQPAIPPISGACGSGGGCGSKGGGCGSGGGGCGSGGG